MPSTTYPWVDAVRAAVDANPHAVHRKRMCGYEFRPGDMAWNCRQCQKDETCVLCHACFSASHANLPHHDVTFYYTQQGTGCCDCGDDEAWDPDGFCAEHNPPTADGADMDILTSVPPELLATAQADVVRDVNVLLRYVLGRQRGFQRALTPEVPLPLCHSAAARSAPEKLTLVQGSMSADSVSHWLSTLDRSNVSIFDSGDPAVYADVLAVFSRTPGQTILVLGVQFLNRASFVHKLVADHQLLDELLGAFASLVVGGEKSSAADLCIFQGFRSKEEYGDDNIHPWDQMALRMLRTDVIHVYIELATLVQEMMSALILNVVTFDTSDSQSAITALVGPVLESLCLWLATTHSYFPPDQLDRPVGDPDVAVGVHFPLHHTFVLILRAATCAPALMDAFQAAVNATLPHPASCDRVGRWHRLMLVRPLLRALVWDAQVHVNMWRRNGFGVINHSLNYGEPFYCFKLRDLDLLGVQYAVATTGMDTIVPLILEEFDISTLHVPEFEDSMLAECFKVLCQIATELPLGTSSLDSRLRRLLVLRLCCKPSTHSELFKCVTEFCAVHEVQTALSSLSLDAAVKTLTKDYILPNQKVYTLDPRHLELYDATTIHLTRKQHEAARLNRLEHRVDTFKKDPMPSTYLPAVPPPLHVTEGEAYLNAVDVKKGEFLCPQCKSISNVLVPVSLGQGNSSSVDVSADGLAKLCMSIHRVATGAIEKAHPRRYIATACHAVFTSMWTAAITDMPLDKIRPLAAAAAHLRHPELSVREMLATGEASNSKVDALVDTHTLTQVQRTWHSVVGAKPLLLHDLGSVGCALPPLDDVDEDATSWFLGEWCDGASKDVGVAVLRGLVQASDLSMVSDQHSLLDRVAVECRPFCDQAWAMLSTVTSSPASSWLSLPRLPDALVKVVHTWVHTFETTYDTMADPQGVLAQWRLKQNCGPSWKSVLQQDLNAAHVPLSTLHAHKCGRGVGMFLLVLEGKVLLVSGKLAAYYGPSLYVDAHGEGFGESHSTVTFRGRPLFLQSHTRDALLRLWATQGIPLAIVQAQNMATHVVPNSHY
ncbi:hypothetical protein B5M09_006903 [Aphanomyces astaci]|uniref:E3 ubiquitin-protein ligase n=1 Tax=Aphanomyces astaci TaxID=112090 RepID=A0A425CVL0_APHAT|nr:hypothetical protein B5M09_006903 [Aphanomyces astaci]